MSLTGGVSSRHTGIFGIQYAKTPEGTKILNQQGKDAVGNKYQTTGERQKMRADGFKNVHGQHAADAANRNAASAASQRATQTYNQAASNGNITKMEQRNINSANRDANVAKQTVVRDNARTHLGHVQRQVSADGKVTPFEQTRLNGAQKNLNNAQAHLDNLKKNDAKLDARDAKQNTFGARIGSAVQDAVGIGRKVLPTFAGPSPAIPKPHVHVAAGGRPHVSMGCGGAAGPQLHKCGTGASGSFGVLGNRPLGFGQQLGMMASGHAKAQNKLSDTMHKLQAGGANAALKNTTARADADGFRSNFEKIDIAGAKRNANIANKQVSYDNQRKHVGHLEQRYASDGVMTLGERVNLGRERTQLGNMGKELNKLKANDARADVRDAAVKANPFNQFRNASGVAQHKAGEFLKNFTPMVQPRPVFASAIASVGSAVASVASSAAQGLANLQSTHNHIQNYAQSNIRNCWGPAGGFTASASNSWSSGSAFAGVSASASGSITTTSFSSSASFRMRW